MNEDLKLEFVRIRKLLGNSQAQMAELLGVSRNYVYLIEAGKKNPSASLVSKLVSLSRENETGMLTNEFNQSAADKCVNTNELLADLIRRMVIEEDWQSVSELSAVLARRQETPNSSGEMIQKAG